MSDFESEGVGENPTRSTIKVNNMKDSVTKIQLLTTLDGKEIIAVTKEFKDEQNQVHSQAVSSFYKGTLLKVISSESGISITPVEKE